MGNRKITAKTIKNKEGIHPGSRKASQVARVSLRTHKLQVQARGRKGAAHSKIARPLFFLHSLSSPHPLTLPSLRALISTVYLTRHDQRINELEAERRAGRPKPKEMLDLEETRRRETAEYETGMEVPDLTHAPTAKLMYKILESGSPIQSSHVDLIRQIRLFKNSPDEVVVSKPGRTNGMGLLFGDEVGEGDDWTNGEVESVAAGAKGEGVGMEVEA